MELNVKPKTLKKRKAKSPTVQSSEYKANKKVIIEDSDSSTDSSCDQDMALV